MNASVFTVGIFALLACSACQRSHSPAASTASSSSTPPGTSSVPPPASSPAAATSARSPWSHTAASFLQGSPFSMLMHADTPYQMMRGKVFEREKDCHLSLPRLEAGHIGAFSAVLFVDEHYQETGTVSYCHRAKAKIDRILASHPDVLAPALSADDFAANYASGHISVFRTMEGSWCLQGKLSAIDDYYKQGVRMIGLTWKNDDRFATSWTYYGMKGLTKLGRRAVRHMNDLGIVVDVSHMSDRSIDDVLNTSTAPVFASHSNARAVSKHPRNLTDEQIRRIAKSGGVIGVTFFRFHLRMKGTPTIADVVAHIRHLRDVGGLGVVALGSDFDGIRHGPKNLEDASKLPNLRRALAQDGFTPKQIRAIFGGNFIRALKQVQSKRKKPAAAPVASQEAGKHTETNSQISK